MIFPKASQSSRSAEGFTLLEIVIAVTLVALLSVGLWAALRISIRSWTRGTEFVDANQRHRSILDMVRKQIASTYGVLVPPDLKTGGASYPFFSGTETSFDFVSVNSLQFQESPGLTLVTYEVAQSTQGSYSLLEKESRYLGQLPNRENPWVHERTTSILDGLTACSFEYYDPGNNENPPEWVKEWDAQKSRRLPTAIAMSMIAHDARGNTLVRHMVVPIQHKSDVGTVFANPFGGARGIGP
jgi:general secretion pathway protein J